MAKIDKRRKRDSMYETKTSMIPKISIIVTVYNAEKYLRECLDSALKQTLSELEIVCIDGNSTDKTLLIIGEYIKRDPRIKVFQQTGTGIGAAKNCGIEKASGEYITFLDADDYYVDNTALDQMYQQCIRTKVAICGALRSTLLLDGNVITENLHRNDLKNNSTDTKYQYKDRPYDYHFHSYIYATSLIKNNHIQFAETTAYDDTHFFIRAMLAAHEFVLAPVELYRYRCGEAYNWAMEKANDAIDSLIDQLILTKENQLDWLHWLTVQRINYEYGEIFTKNILMGDYCLLEKMIYANQQISAEILERVLKNPPPQSWYVEPMIHRNINEMPLRKSLNQYMPAFILEPLWNILFLRNYDDHMYKTKIESLEKHIQILENSWSFKMGRMLTFIPRKIRYVLLSMRNNDR